jgi:FkbM family methyltransferase
MSLKRQIAERVGRLLGVYIVPKGETWTLPERGFLERFFTAFQVDCVFDVGANDGQYARRIRMAGFKGPVISFEPIPRLAAKLREHAKSDTNWFIEEVALGDNERSAQFNIMAATGLSSLLEPDSTFTGTVLAHSNRVVDTISVTTRLLADYFDTYRDRLKFQRPFLKIDAQGTDLAVARGAGERLRDFVGLQSELSFVPIYRSQEDYKIAVEFYEQNGFQLSGLLPLGAELLFPRLSEMDCVMFNTRFKCAS